MSEGVATAGPHQVRISDARKTVVAVTTGALIYLKHPYVQSGFLSSPSLHFDGRS